MSDPDGGRPKGISFERIIVWSDGHQEIEGVTPKRLAPPGGGRDPLRQRPKGGQGVCQAFD
jgi:hypothetical protein